MTSRVRAWTPALVWAAVLFWLSSRPSLSVNLDSGLDKVAHFGAFSILGLLLAYGAVARGMSLWWAVVLGLAYGATDEIHQHFVPGRYPDVGDWVADALGVAAGGLSYFWLRSRRRSRRSARGAIRSSRAIHD